MTETVGSWEWQEWREAWNGRNSGKLRMAGTAGSLEWQEQWEAEEWQEWREVWNARNGEKLRNARDSRKLGMAGS